MICKELLNLRSCDWIGRDCLHLYRSCGKIGDMGASDLLGRIGGEEVAALLIDVSAAAGLQVAERLRKSVQTLASCTEDERRVELTASIGLTKRQYKEESLAQLMKRADTAMYQAKAAGRNRIATDPTV